MIDQLKLAFFAKGSEHFNKKEFFEAHEEWEEIWLKCTLLDEKLFFQSLILLAGVGVHLQKIRPSAAERLVLLGKKKLTQIKDPALQFYIEQLQTLFDVIFQNFEEDDFQIPFEPFLMTLENPIFLTQSFR
ncbi:DUF309 domain-containing protein [bacterium]|nr:DUF309 domain-containing protein [bacterium]